MIRLENLKGSISCVILTYDETYFSLCPLVDLGLNKGLIGISVKVKVSWYQSIFSKPSLLRFHFE